MDQQTRTETASTIMESFAGETGLTDSRPARRYLWTDAFAVCNYLALYEQSRDETYKSLALRLVEQVHHTLGRHREDDARSGWISGLSAEDGRQHPTAGGLRIGKKLPERRPDEPFDRRAEWDRDGQYYHYLTKWMHALNRVGQVTGDRAYIVWAVELAQAAHEAFVYRAAPGGRRRMYWKMSIDLSYPQVPSMGQHDPLDGLITYHELQAALEDGDGATADLGLAAQIDEMATICRGQRWATEDPLGLGGLLSDVYRLAQLLHNGLLQQPDLLRSLLRTLLHDAHAGLKSYTSQDPLSLSAVYRLPFRELGLSIGLHAAEMVQEPAQEALQEFAEQANALRHYLPMARRIEQFWLDPAHRDSETWQGHLDINRVMLATSLIPDGYLRL